MRGNSHGVSLPRAESAERRAPRGEFHGYQPFAGPAPSRKRTDNNPLECKEYLLHALNHI